MRQDLKKWFAYASIITFCTYWLSNLLLWYPWSYNTTLGMVLMFVLMTPIWCLSVFHCLKRHPRSKLIQGAVHTALIFTSLAAVLDYVFFGMIRDALTELYHPTTLYGYAFLIFLPFAEIILFKKYLKEKIELKKKDYLLFGLLGLGFFLAITAIILFDITLTESMFKFVSLIFVSLIVFNLVLWIVLGKEGYKNKPNQIVLLSILCVIVGMFIGKFGAGWGLPWWIYYTLPLLMTVALPPILLKMTRKQILVYLLLSFISAPLIHSAFSFFFGWTEYMPFLEIPYYKSLSQ